jgi:hypothetical protein
MILRRSEGHKSERQGARDPKSTSTLSAAKENSDIMLYRYADSMNRGGGGMAERQLDTYMLKSMKLAIIDHRHNRTTKCEGSKGHV